MTTVRCPNCRCEAEAEVDIDRMLVGCPNDQCSVSQYFAGEGGVVTEVNITQ